MEPNTWQLSILRMPTCLCWCGYAYACAYVGVKTKLYFSEQNSVINTKSKCTAVNIFLPHDRLIMAARVELGEKRKGVGTRMERQRVTSSRHVTTRYLFIESFIDVAEVMRSKLQKTLQLLPGHLLHNKPVICNGEWKTICILSYFSYIKNCLEIEGNLRIVL